MEESLINVAYERLCGRWADLSDSDRAVLLQRFGVLYSFNSGYIENDAITYHDTAEVFDKDGISNYTGDVRTIYEIVNLKHAWAWLQEAAAIGHMLDLTELLDAHRILTAGTYDSERWSKGERPGTLKQNDYRVADDVGLPPSEVEAALVELLQEIDIAMESSAISSEEALTIACYAHASLVDIHPFADGNGRIARLLMNLILMVSGMPPCSISAEDRLAYFGALDAFHIDGALEPFKEFCRIQSIKSWGELGVAIEPLLD